MDTARALQALAAGRRDCDPYSAIAFEAAGFYEKPYDRLPTSIIWRRGKFRPGRYLSGAETKKRGRENP